MNDLYNNPAVLEAFKEVYNAKDWWRYKGKRAAALESEFSTFHHSEFGVSVCNGTIALDIIFKAIELKKGDEVLLPAYDFYSLPKSVLNFEATPIFVDVNAQNFTIDAQSIQAKITSKTKAIIAVHIDGSVAELDTISQIAKEHNIHFIEDCAQAHGAVYKNKKVGSYGDFALFSFGGVKLMTAGQGGMILAKKESDYLKCYAITNRGILPNNKINSFGLVGENFQLSEMQSAILLPQLKQLKALSQQREAAMNLLDSEIEEISSIQALKQFQNTQIRAQMRYSFLVDADSRDTLISHLKKLEIPIFTGYSSIQSDERLLGLFTKNEYPNAQKAQSSMLSVFHPFLLLPKEGLLSLIEGLHSFQH